ncbi:hypothetical protein G6O67_001045 [Ophiocordyceps sinensis]|uniref:ATP-grasp domain-containing protein n=2 Tax=Ophiocordyceps sinensis TaxID=72228 RepID=A0A8H4PWM9_9HYPO|nr:hypothetical protein G6O67_001045 [Ophiocordyceps sinensis]
MAEPSAGWHLFKNLFLLALSLVLLPIDSFVIGLVWARNRLVPPRVRHEASTRCRKTVLVTGVNMSKGLCLARLFHRRGHRVIAADSHSLAPGRVSAAVDRFYVLPSPGPPPDVDGAERDPYVLGLLRIVKLEGVHLWISVSDVSAAAHDALARDVIEHRTEAKAAQLSLKDVQTLHEKDSFMRHVESLGLPIPGTQVVAGRDAIVDFLTARGGLRLQPGASQYLLKPVGVNDLARFNMPLLPLASEDETVRRINAIPFGRDPCFIMQEFIRGREFCTHALIVRGRVRAFVACPSSELLMHYTALPADSPLSRQMLAFTEVMAKAGGTDWTGHVSFDFLVKGGKADEHCQLYPIECNPRVHTAVVLFNDTLQVVDEYLDMLATPESAPFRQERPLLVPSRPQRYYWLGQDLVERVLYPVYQMLVLWTLSPAQLAASLGSFGQHFVGWKDGTFEAWDPWPWWWLYHVYWPMQFLGFVVRGRWHKVNVSTGKVFEAS